MRLVHCLRAQERRGGTRVRSITSWHCPMSVRAREGALEAMEEELARRHPGREVRDAAAGAHADEGSDGACEAPAMIKAKVSEPKA